MAEEQKELTNKEQEYKERYRQYLKDMMSDENCDVTTIEDFDTWAEEERKEQIIRCKKHGFLNCGDCPDRCPKCGSGVFFIDTTDTHVMVNREIQKTYPGDYGNKNCIRCTVPDQYKEDYADYEPEDVEPDKLSEDDAENLNIEVGVHDFIHTFKRMPTKEEFSDFVNTCKNGVQAQIDWDIIFSCSKDVLNKKGG